jgi:hypothetical protein
MKMKRLKIYFILLLLFGFSSAFAQALQSKTTENAQKAKSLEDPKLNPEELALRLSAGEDNPAKIDESSMIDPKIEPKTLPTDEDYGTTNSKPAEGQDIDPKMESEKAQNERQIKPDPAVRSKSSASQPAGEKSGTITDYRNMPAGSNDQPRGDEPTSIPNYREIQGSGDQPPGDIPSK